MLCVFNTSSPFQEKAAKLKTLLSLIHSCLVNAKLCYLHVSINDCITSEWGRCTPIWVILTEIQCIQNVSVNRKKTRGIGIAIPISLLFLKHAWFSIHTGDYKIRSFLYTGSEMLLACDHFINKVNVDFWNILFVISWLCHSLEVKILTFTRLFVPAFWSPVVYLYNNLIDEPLTQLSRFNWVESICYHSFKSLLQNKQDILIKL